MAQNQSITHAHKGRESLDSHTYLEVWQCHHHHQDQLVLGKASVLVNYCYEIVV